MKTYDVKIKEIIFIFNVLIFYMLISMNKYVTFLGFFVFIVFSFVVNIKFYRVNSILISKMVILLLLFQNTCIGIGAHLGGNTDSSIQLLTQIPTVFILVSYIIIFYRRSFYIRIDFLLFVLLLLICFLMSEGIFQAELVYIRNFLIFYLAFTIGKNHLDSLNKKYEFIDFSIKLALVAGIFGIIGMILGNNFFSAIGVQEVYIGKNYYPVGYLDFSQRGIPGNFRTLVMSVWVNRMASFYYDPVNFSYFMSYGTLLSILSRQKIFSIILLICNILTFGKGGLLLLGIALMCVILHAVFKIKLTEFNRKLILGIITTVFCFLVFFIMKYYKDDFGTNNHFYGFFSAIPLILKNPLGHGLGTAGNILKGYTDVKLFVAAESALSNMAYQIGIPGLLFFVFILLNLGKVVFTSIAEQENSTQKILCIAASYIPFAIILVSVFQENTITPQCIIPYMLIVGAYSNKVTCKYDTFITP